MAHPEMYCCIMRIGYKEMFKDKVKPHKNSQSGNGQIGEFLV